MQLSSSITTMPPDPMIDPSLLQILVVHGRVEHFVRNTSAGGPAGLHGFYLAFSNGAFSDVVDESFEGRPERHLDQPRVFHLADEGENFCACTFWASGFGEPGGTASNDGSDVVPG